MSLPLHLSPSSKRRKLLNEASGMKGKENDGVVNNESSSSSFEGGTSPTRCKAEGLAFIPAISISST